MTKNKLNQSLKHHLGLMKEITALRIQATHALSETVFSQNNWHFDPVSITFGTLTYNATLLKPGRNKEKYISISIDSSATCCKFQDQSDSISSVDIYTIKQALRSIGIDWFIGIDSLVGN